MTLYYKMRQILQNATAILLQNGTVIMNCDNFITKCDSYYKIQRLLQIAAVQSETLHFKSSQTYLHFQIKVCTPISLVQSHVVLYNLNSFKTIPRVNFEDMVEAGRHCMRRENLSASTTP